MPHQLQSHMRGVHPMSQGHHHAAHHHPMSAMPGYPHQQHSCPQTPQTPAHHGHRHHQHHPHGHPGPRYGGGMMPPPHGCGSHGSGGSFPGPAAGEHAPMHLGHTNGHGHGYPGEQPLFHDQRFVGSHPAERQHYGHHPDHIGARSAAGIPYRRSPTSPHNGRSASASAAAAQMMAAQQQHGHPGAGHPHAGYVGQHHPGYGAPRHLQKQQQQHGLFRPQQHQSSQQALGAVPRTTSQEQQQQQQHPARPASAVPSGPVKVPQAPASSASQPPQPPKRTASDEEEAASALLLAAGGLGSKQSSPAPASRQSSVASQSKQNDVADRPAAASNCSPSFEIEQAASQQEGKQDGDNKDEGDEAAIEIESGSRTSSPTSAKDKRHRVFMRKRKGASADENDEEEKSEAGVDDKEQQQEEVEAAPDKTAEQDQTTKDSPPRPHPCHISPLSTDSTVLSPSDDHTIETAAETVDESRSVSSALVVPGPATAVAVSRRGLSHRRDQSDASGSHPNGATTCSSSDVVTATPVAARNNSHLHRSNSAPLSMQHSGRRPLPSVVTMPHFPSLLHDALTNSSHAGNVVEWLRNGRGWRVLRWDEMHRTVLPEHFPELCVNVGSSADEDEEAAAGKETLNNFLWHVRAWGFVECREAGPDMGSYKHNLFLRGNPSLCLQMRLSSAVSSPKRADSSEMSPPSSLAHQHKGAATGVGPTRLDAASIFKTRPGAASVRVRPGQPERQLTQTDSSTTGGSPHSVRSVMGATSARSHFTRQLHVPALTPSASQSDDTEGAAATARAGHTSAASRLVSASPSKRKLRVEYEVGPLGENKRARSISLQGSGDAGTGTAVAIRRTPSGNSFVGSNGQTPKLVWQHNGAPAGPSHLTSPPFQVHHPQHIHYHPRNNGAFPTVTPRQGGYQHKRTISDTPSSTVPGDIAAQGHPMPEVAATPVAPAMMGRASSSRGRARTAGPGIISAAPAPCASLSVRGGRDETEIRSSSSFPVSTRGKGSAACKSMCRSSFPPGSAVAAAAVAAAGDAYSVGERMAGAAAPVQAQAQQAHAAVAIAVSRKTKHV